MDKVDILSRTQIDDEAKKFLIKYRPNALKEATKLDLENLPPEILRRWAG